MCGCIFIYKCLLKKIKIVINLGILFIYDKEKRTVIKLIVIKKEIRFI